MKYKILFIAFIILIGCTTSNNLKGDKDNISDKGEEVLKPEIDEVKIPQKKKKDNELHADLDVDKNTQEKKSLVKIFREKKDNLALNKNRTSNEMLILENDNDFTIKEYELKEVNVEIGEDLYISLKYPNWNVKSITPNQIKLVKNENFKENSVFQFKTFTPGTINIIFVRSDEINRIFWRQPYRISVITKMAVQEKRSDIKLTSIEGNKDIKESLEQNNKETSKLDKEQFKNMKDLADKYFDDNNYKDAKILYLKLLEEDIHNPEILYKLGIIEKDNSNKFKAYEYFKAALEEKGSDYSINSLIEVLKLLKDKKRYKDALDTYFDFGLIENLNKKLAEELDILLCDLYFCLNDFFRSSKEYRRFINLFPYSDYYAKALFYLAYSLENLTNNPDFREAYKIYQIIIDRFPDTKYFLLSKKRLLYLDRHYLKIH